MIHVITSENPVLREAAVINQLFYEGMDLLHIRKPLYSWEDMDKLISKIDKRFHPQLVLHSHYELINVYSIKRLHFKEKERQKKKHLPYLSKNCLLSTSIHTMDHFNALKSEWDFTFISPCYESISKCGYGLDSTVFKDIGKRTNWEVSLVGLGGIEAVTIPHIAKQPIDGIALLGAIWLSKNPRKLFIDCKNIYNQYMK